jgi:hypothetical protein
VILRELLNKEKTLAIRLWRLSGIFYFHPSHEQARLGLKTKKPGAFAPGFFLCSGERIRTSDLWVMSPTSYHCSTPQFFRGANIIIATIVTKKNFIFMLFFVMFAISVTALSKTE